jgi:hypothetical protein
MKRVIALGFSLLIPFRASATLVVFIPTNSGIVIAADSRHTIAGKFCDGETKIVVSPHSRLAAAAVTGQPEWYDRPALPGTNPCERFSKEVPVFDALRLVRGFLAEHPTWIQNQDLSNLRDRCVRELDAYFSSHPLAASSAGVGPVFVVLIATFDPKKHVSSICWFTVSVGGSLHKALGSDPTFRTWALSDSETPVAVAGEKDFYEKYVDIGKGQRFILHKPKATVSETDAGYGKSQATDVIRAASRIAAEMQIPLGIGGPIDVASLDGTSDVKIERVPNFDAK